jgi:hypothetical protein
MPLRINCQPEFADYLEAQRFHDRTRRILVSLSLLLIGAWYRFQGGGWWGLGLVVAYVLVGRPYVTRASVWRDWTKAGADQHGGGVFEFDEEGMHALDDAGQRTTTRWARFRKAHESPGLFLVYLSPRVYVYFPKRSLRTPEQNELRKLLREHVGPRLPD